MNKYYESVDKIYQQFKRFNQKSQIENDIQNESFQK